MENTPQETSKKKSNAGRPKGSKNKFTKNDLYEKLVWVANRLGGARRLFDLCEKDEEFEKRFWLKLWDYAGKQMPIQLEPKLPDGQSGRVVFEMIIDGNKENIVPGSTDAGKISQE